MFFNLLVFITIRDYFAERLNRILSYILLFACIEMFVVDMATSSGMILTLFHCVLTSTLLGIFLVLA